jgi:hypothetical protein
VILLGVFALAVSSSMVAEDSSARRLVADSSSSVSSMVVLADSRPVADSMGSAQGTLDCKEHT